MRNKIIIGMACMTGTLSAQTAQLFYLGIKGTG